MQAQPAPVLSTSQSQPPPNFPKCGFKRLSKVWVKTFGQNFRSKLSVKTFGQNVSVKTFGQNVSVKTFGQNLLAPKPLTISINPKPNYIGLGSANENLGFQSFKFLRFGDVCPILGGEGGEGGRGGGGRVGGLSK